MTRRPMLWIAATAVAASTVTAIPSVAGADPAPLWTVTIDAPATDEVPTRTMTIEGAAEWLGLQGSADSVTITVHPVDLPADCGPPTTWTGPVERGRYRVPVDVACNGPHRVEVVAENQWGATSGGPAVREIGVAEPPPTPDAVGLAETPEGGLAVTWGPTTDVDSEGWILKTNDGEIPFGPGVVRTTLPPASRRATVSVRAVRWGADGPSKSTVMSSYSMENRLAGQRPPSTTTEPPQSTDPEPPPSSNPPTTSTRPSGGGVPPSSTTSGPTRGTGAPSTTLPEGYSEELPFGTPDDSFVPGDPGRRPVEAEESAVSSSSPVAGLVRTTEKRSPGLVAPFALGLLMITIAAHIAWYLRRSRPTGGQGHPG
ncbi:MAG TPA: hypothetical protein VFU19_03390 [Iamia sp.]|nr:hypothetical protein [Iamia sp.]